MRDLEIHTPLILNAQIVGGPLGAYRADARTLYGKLQSGQIFGAFSEQDREAIWTELRSCTTDCLIPSFFGFFEDLNWVRDLADCVKRLMNLSPRETIFSALEKNISDVNQRADQCVIQEFERTFVSKPGSLVTSILGGEYALMKRDDGQVLFHMEKFGGGFEREASRLCLT
jgi:hypothetical protein